jgi:DNA-binding CsgD family transcriptional regulator
VNEHQIVRPLRRGESLPPFATLDLILMAHFQVDFVPVAKTKREMAHIKAGACEENHGLIVKWIAERKGRIEMAEALGIHDRTVSKYIQKHKLASGLKPLKIRVKQAAKSKVLRINKYSARVAEIKRMVEEGKKTDEISEVLGVAHSTVNRTVRKFNLTPPGRRAQTQRMFAEKEAEILEYCKQHGLCKASNKYGTHYMTMQRFTERIK